MDIITREENIQASTVYIGGGTPSALDDVSFSFLLESINEYFLKEHTPEEFTVEVNPESVSENTLKMMKEHRVNRISIGVQSLNDRKLRFLCRPHTREQAYRSIRAASKAGFRRLSIDLMYGVASETLKDWEEELREAASHEEIAHISAYALSCEKNTPFFRLSKERSITADEGSQAAMYRAAMGILPRQSFLHYEVSNFARSGFACVHNQCYWNNDAYIGIGASAVSYRDGVRERYSASVLEYLRSLLEHERIPVEYSERLSAVERTKETAALQIRRKEGIDFAQFKQKTGYDLLALKEAALEKLIGEGYLERVNSTSGTFSGVRATEQGFLFCDDICGEFVT